MISPGPQQNQQGTCKRQTLRPAFLSRHSDQSSLIGPWENLSAGICGQQRPRSSSAQSDQGLYRPLTESLDTTDYRMYESESAYFAYVQRDFSLDVAQLLYEILMASRLIRLHGFFSDLG